MQRWEYKYLLYNDQMVMERNTDGSNRFVADSIAEYSNKLGRSGWELVASVNTSKDYIEVIFKREISEKMEKLLKQHEKEDELKLLQLPVGSLDFPVRALNAFKKADINTLGQLISFSRDDLKMIRNLGHASITEVEYLLRSKGLALKR